MVIDNPTSSNVNLVVKGAASQSANLQEWKRSDDQHLMSVDENGNVRKVQIYPKKSKSMNLAFDVTPAKYVTGLITEKGVCEASEKGLKGLFK